jgi:hypothetical protein
MSIFNRRSPGESANVEVLHFEVKLLKRRPAPMFRILVQRSRFPMLE